MKAHKIRRPRTLHAALEAAIDQLGGAEKAGDVIERSRSWMYSAADPDRDPDKRATVTYAQARALARAGGVAIAEDMALLAGGAFMPGVPDLGPGEVQALLADYVAEHGQFASELIQRAADGKVCTTDAMASLKPLDDALRALLALRADLMRVADGGAS